MVFRGRALATLYCAAKASRIPSIVCSPSLKNWLWSCSGQSAGGRARANPRCLKSSGRHESFQRFGGAALPANVVNFWVPGFVFIPGQQGKVTRGLALLKAKHVSQRDHPPVVGFEFCGSADVTDKGLVPCHFVSPLLRVCCLTKPDAAKRFLSLTGSKENQARQQSFAGIS